MQALSHASGAAWLQSTLQTTLQTSADGSSARHSTFPVRWRAPAHLPPDLATQVVKGEDSAQAFRKRAATARQKSAPNRRSRRNRCRAANASIEAKFPRLFIAPLPDHFNTALLRSCPAGTIRRAAESARAAQASAAIARWRIEAWPQPLRDSSEMMARWKQSSPDLPFGPITWTSPALGTHPPPTAKAAAGALSSRRAQAQPLPLLSNSHNSSYTLFFSEYDHEVFFHQMALGYCRRVYRPEQADLIYFPVYRAKRLACSQTASSLSGYENLLHTLNNWTKMYSEISPPYASRNWGSPHAGTRLFHVVGGLCACHAAPASLSSPQDLQVTRKFRMPAGDKSSGKSINTDGSNGYSLSGASKEAAAAATAATAAAAAAPTLRAFVHGEVPPPRRQPSMLSPCNPLSAVDVEGARRLRLVAWEVPSQGDVVTPYASQLHERLPWPICEARPYLVLFVAGHLVRSASGALIDAQKRGARTKQKLCAKCGPCTAPGLTQFALAASTSSTTTSVGSSAEQVAGGVPATSSSRLYVPRTKPLSISLVPALALNFTDSKGETGKFGANLALLRSACLPDCKVLRALLATQLSKSDAPDVFLWTQAGEMPINAPSSTLSTTISKSISSEQLASSPTSSFSPSTAARSRVHARKWPPKPTELYDAMLQSTFCLQPPGDTLTRKGLYESFLTGCIPVVFREDDAFLEQLAFSRYIPYKSLWVCLPARDISAGTLDVVATLRALPPAFVHDRRRRIRRWARRLAFSAVKEGAAGYNNLDHPDAFTTTLQEVWRNARAGED